MDKKLFKSILILVSFAIILAVLLFKIEYVFMFIDVLITVSFPIILGIVFAFVLNIPMRRIEVNLLKSEKKWVKAIKRPLSLIVSVMLVFVILTGVVVIVIPQFMIALTALFKEINVLLSDSVDWLKYLNISQKEINDVLKIINVDWSSVGGNAVDIIKVVLENVLGVTVNFLLLVLNGVVNVVIAIILAIYILAGKEKLRRHMKMILKATFVPHIYKKIVKALKISNITFSAFLTGQIIEAFILGTLCFIGMLIFQIPHAAMISAMVGVLALIPMLGAYISCILGGFIILMESPWQALGFVVFIIILQQIEGNLIYPRVVGSQVGVSPILILMSIIIGGGLFGLAGIFFAVPVMSVIYQFIRETTKSKLEKLEENESKTEENFIDKR